MSFLYLITKEFRKKPFKQSLESLMEHTRKHFPFLTRLFLTFGLVVPAEQSSYLHDDVITAFSGTERPLVSVL